MEKITWVKMLIPNPSYGYKCLYTCHVVKVNWWNGFYIKLVFIHYYMFNYNSFTWNPSKTTTTKPLTHWLEVSDAIITSSFFMRKEILLKRKEEYKYCKVSLTPL